MVKEITYYKTDDGEVFDDFNKAEKHDLLCRRCKEMDSIVQKPEKEFTVKIDEIPFKRMSEETPENHTESVTFINKYGIFAEGQYYYRKKHDERIVYDWRTKEEQEIEPYEMKDTFWCKTSDLNKFLCEILKKKNLR